MINLEIGIYKDPVHPQGVPGWELILEQEMTPYKITNEPDCPIIVCEKVVPEWLPSFMESGGVCVITGADPELLPFTSKFVGKASIEYIDLYDLDSSLARICSLVSVFDGDGLGTIEIHEKRLHKQGVSQDHYPVFLFNQFGKGGCYYSGVPFMSLITSMGDTLRNVPFLDGFSERITSIDKHSLIKAIRYVLISAFGRRELPYTFLWYYPERYNSAFTFRIDVDGVYGENLLNISKAASENNISLSFFINKSLCEKDEELLLKLDHVHLIGNHASTHNLFTDYNSNKNNVSECKNWLDDIGINNGPWFAAPRGMWNPNLHQALDDMDYVFTSDFGNAVAGFPFFPFVHGKRSKTMQIPVHPFSAERGKIWLEENFGTKIDAQFVMDSFLEVIRNSYQNNYPVMLYSHPEVFGGMADHIFPNIISELEKYNIWNTTLAEFSNWWNFRNKIRFSAVFDQQSKNISIKSEQLDQLELTGLSNISHIFPIFIRT